MARAEFVLRPFEGLPGEPDWVAMREVVPAATATARTTAEHGSRDIRVVTVLPQAWPALHRSDGVVMLALQQHAGSGDASRDLADLLLRVLDLEPGTPIWSAPTRRLTSVDAAYWTRMSGREFLRWAMPHEEEAFMDAFARLHARRESGLGEAGSLGRFLGAFRSCGLVVPVWDLELGTPLETLEAEALALRGRLDEALTVEGPLDANERRARAGLVARQLTLR